MRYTELQVGDAIKIGDVIVTLEHKKGSRARLAISTDHDQTVTFVPCAASNELLDKSDLQALAET